MVRMATAMFNRLHEYGESYYNRPHHKAAITMMLLPLLPATPMERHCFSLRVERDGDAALRCALLLLSVFAISAITPALLFDIAADFHALSMFAI